VASPNLEEQLDMIERQSPERNLSALRIHYDFAVTFAWTRRNQQLRSSAR
jgi:hypothetical protein